MTPAEIKVWLGFAADLDRELRPEIVSGMADIPAPSNLGASYEHLPTFVAFVRCVPADRQIFLPDKKD